MVKQNVQLNGWLCPSSLSCRSEQTNTNISDNLNVIYEDISEVESYNQTSENIVNVDEDNGAHITDNSPPYVDVNDVQDDCKITND